MENKSRVPALTRAIEILDYIQKHTNCSFKDIQDNCNIPRSSIYILINELIDKKLIYQDNNGKYQLWVKLISYGDTAKEQINLRDALTPYLKDLATSIDCLAVHFGIIDGNKGYYLLKITKENTAVEIKSREGSEISFVHAGLGKCLLAFLEEQKRENIIKTLDFTPITNNSIDNIDKFKQEIEKIRKQGWAFDNSEGESEIRCVATPIFMKNKKLLGAISIVGTVNKYKDDVIPSIVEQCLICSKNIEKSLEI